MPSIPSYETWATPQDKATAHGFRSSASTILNSRRFDPDVIEAALAHQDQYEIRRIYNRSLYMPERTQLMQDWCFVFKFNATAFPGCFGDATPTCIFGRKAQD